MLDRLSVNAILKAVIAALSVVVVIMLAAGAWSSWSRLQVDSRIAGVAVPGLERKDEVGAMANAVERFKAVADEKARREADAATQRQQAEAAVQARANEERARTAEERARTAEHQAHAFRAGPASKALR